MIRTFNDKRFNKDSRGEINNELWVKLITENRKQLNRKSEEEIRLERNARALQYYYRKKEHDPNALLKQQIKEEKAKLKLKKEKEKAEKKEKREKMLNFIKKMHKK